MFEIRKLAVIVLALAVGLMMACTTSSSTTEDPIHPGPDYLGSLQFDVNPAGPPYVTVTEVGSPASGTKIAGDGLGNIPNITITRYNEVFVDPTLDFDLTVAWDLAGSDLTNVRIGVNAATILTPSLDNDDQCGGAQWSACAPGGAGPDPAIVYVSDIPSEGAETIEYCQPVGPLCAVMEVATSIHEECGSVTAHWTITDSTLTAYTFWSDLWGDTVASPPADLLLNPYYDPATASIFLRTYEIDTGAIKFPPLGNANTSFAAGEWFYVDYTLDAPGNNGPAPIGINAIESAANILEYGGSTWSASYWYMGGANMWSIRFDPAILEINANDEQFGGDPPQTPSSFP